MASWGIPPLSQAKVLAGPPSLLQHFADHPARKIPLTGSVESWIPLLQQELAQGSLVLLASGDPLFFGIGRLLTQYFPREQLAFYPQVSSVQLASTAYRSPGRRPLSSACMGGEWSSWNPFSNRDPL